MEKIKCLICGKEFKRVCAHVRQIHNMSAREYKQEFGYDVKKGILTDADREHMRELAIINKMPEQLIKAGVKSRFKKGQPGIGKYERSQQTMERLHNLSKLSAGRRKEGIIEKCLVCGKGFYVIKSNIGKAKFCSRHCFMINRNKKLK